MADTTITIRTDEATKRQASTVFESLGMTLSSAVNLFLKQTAIRKTFPCSLETGLISDSRSTYPDGLFELFGSGKSDGDIKIKKLKFSNDVEREDL